MKRGSENKKVFSTNKKFISFAAKEIEAQESDKICQM